MPFVKMSRHLGRPSDAVGLDSLFEQFAQRNDELTRRLIAGHV
jgi:hypothetical protein